MREVPLGYFTLHPLVALSPAFPMQPLRRFGLSLLFMRGAPVHRVPVRNTRRDQFRPLPG